VVTLLAILVSVIVWWKKYGKDMFSMIKTMNNIPKNKEFPFDTDILRKNLNFPDDFYKNLKNLQDLMGKPPKKR
jgi:hypothetical protein